MKKILVFLFLAMFVIVPMSFAKTAITDKDLGDVTAQEGVTINFDCFTIGAITVAVQSWGDGDGCTSCGGGYSGVGFVGASITMDSDFITMTGNLTIDVGTSGSRSALLIGLPTLNLKGSITQVVKLGSTPNLATGMILGTSYMSGIQMSPKGNLIIFAH